MNVPVTQEQDTSNNGGILSTIGGIIGLMVGGPTGAAIGSGMGSLAGGGSFTDAFRTGIMNLGIGALPGGQAYLAQNAIGQIFAPTSRWSAFFPGYRDRSLWSFAAKQTGYSLLLVWLAQWHRPCPALQHHGSLQSMAS